MAAELQELMGLQLSEVEMLRSMYPHEGEFSIRNSLVEIMRRFTDGKREVLPNQLEFSLRLQLNQREVSVPC